MHCSRETRNRMNCNSRDSLQTRWAMTSRVVFLATAWSATALKYMPEWWSLIQGIMKCCKQKHKSWQEDKITTKACSVVLIINVVSTLIDTTENKNTLQRTKQVSFHRKALVPAPSLMSSRYFSIVHCPVRYRIYPAYSISMASLQNAEPTFFTFLYFLINGELTLPRVFLCDTHHYSPIRTAVTDEIR